MTDLFPTFKYPSQDDAFTLFQFYETRVDGIVNLAKLLVWAFVAGYSEKFVTGILGQLERGKGTSGD